MDEQKMLVYGQLHYPGSKEHKVLLGIARGMKEFHEYAEEYKTVFGSMIHVCWMELSEEEYQIERKLALSNLLSSFIPNFKN